MPESERNISPGKSRHHPMAADEVPRMNSKFVGVQKPGIVGAFCVLCVVGVSGAGGFRLGFRPHQNRALRLHLH